jgi:hypothetical protein
VGHTRKGVVTLSAISLISAIELQVKSLKLHASAFAVIGQFRWISLNVTTPIKRLNRLNANLKALSNQKRFLSWSNGCSGAAF